MSILVLVILREYTGAKEATYRWKINLVKNKRENKREEALY